MLSPFDDYPIHSSALPVAHTASSDPNHYDRYWFNGLARDGSVYFAGAMGHYPVRNIIDAAFSVIKDGVQYSLFTSGRMPADRSTVCGPIRVEVIEPLKTLRFVADETDGLGCDVTFRHRSEPVEEPRQYRVSDSGLVLTDHTRLTQWGTWEGKLIVEGREIHLDQTGTWGLRDRSWGIRPVGEQVAQNREPRVPRIFWLWAPLHFDEFGVHFAVQEESDGRRWLQTAHFVGVTGGADVPVGQLEPSFEIQWTSGTRHAHSATLHLADRRGNRWQLDLQTLYTFYMRGIGYWHPTWSHGSNHGVLETAREDLVLADFDPSDRSGMHFQHVVRATLSGPGVSGRKGIGLLELIPLGDHEPTGLQGFFNPPAG